MKAMIRFNKGLMGYSRPTRAWLLVLVSMNVVAPLWFIQRPEAQVAVLAFLASAMLMTGLTSRFGFTRILGLGHILWLPMVIWLATRLGQIPTESAMGIWVRALIAVNSVSLVIDLADVIRYLAGDRDELVAVTGATN